MKTVAAVAFVLAMSAFGRDKTDVLVMKNGDRITCEIKKLEGGILVVSIDYVDGNISIDWNKVERVESDFLFAVKLQDGTTLAGTLVTQDASPILEIQPVSAAAPISVTHDTVVGLDQASLRFWHRFNGGVTVGSQYSKGNETTQYSLGTDVAYEESRWSARSHYNSSLSSSTGADTATRNQADLIVDRLMRRKNFFYEAGLNYLQSTVQSIEKQWGVGGGVGVFLQNTNHVRWTAQSGLAWQKTTYTPTTIGPDVQNIFAFLVSTNVQAFRFKRTRLTASASVLPALNDAGRVFSRVNMSYYLKLFGKIDWNLSAYGSWDNRPPPQLQGSDYGSSTGFSYSFGNH